MIGICKDKCVFWDVVAKVCLMRMEEKLCKACLLFSPLSPPLEYFLCKEVFLSFARLTAHCCRLALKREDRGIFIRVVRAAWQKRPTWCLPEKGSEKSTHCLEITPAAPEPLSLLTLATQKEKHPLDPPPPLTPSPPTPLPTPTTPYFPLPLQSNC